MDATCTIQDSIHVFSLVHKYVSRILGTYHRKLSVHCRFYYDEIRKTVKYTNESVILKIKIDVV